MECIRCLLADIPERMLADIMQKLIETGSEFSVVGRAESESEVIDYLNNNSVDVVIHNMNEVNPSQGIYDLLKRSPKIVAVGLAESGRRICVCVQDIGPEELKELIEGVVNIHRFR